MREAVESRLGLRQASEQQADAVVKGTISRYEPDLPVQYTGDESQRQVTVTRRLVQVTVSVEILDQKQGKSLWQRNGLILEGDYTPGQEATGPKNRPRQAGDEHRGGSPVAMVILGPQRPARYQQLRMSDLAHPPRGGRASTDITSARCTSASTSFRTKWSPRPAWRRALPMTSSTAASPPRRIHPARPRADVRYQASQATITIQTEYSDSVDLPSVQAHLPFQAEGRGAALVDRGCRRGVDIA